MFKNFLSFFLVALVAVQASPRYTFDLSENEVDTYLNIGDIIEKIIEELEKLIGNANVEQIVQKIIEWIKNILGQQASTYKNVKECIEEQKPKIKEIAEQARDGAKDCVEDAKTKLEALKPKAEEIRQKAETLVKESAEAIKQCLKGSDKWKCIKEVREKMAAGLEEIKQAALELRSEAESIAKEARACVEGVKQDTIAKTRAVLEDIKACIKGQYEINFF